MSNYFWSRKFSLKVFGGVFLLLLSCNRARPDDSAINAATRAVIISTGLKEYSDSLKKEYSKILINTVKKHDLEIEAITLSVAAKIAIDKNISFKYQDKDITLTTNSIQVRIPF